MAKSSSCSTNNTSSSDAVGRRNCYRGHWRPAEDDKLRDLVLRYGPQNWNFIAEHLHGRSGKSCRLRWYNQLDPNINKKPFSEEEEERLLSVHRIYGNKWACIAKYFRGRTDNAVKNHYHVVMARRKREHRFASSTTARSGGRISVAGANSRLVGGPFGLFTTAPATANGDKYMSIVEDASNRRNDSKLGLNSSFSKFSLEQVPFIDFLGVGISSN